MKETAMNKKRSKRSSSIFALGSILNNYTVSTESTDSQDIDKYHHFALKNKIQDNNPNVRIVNEIINKIFDDKKGFYEVSSSRCSSLRRFSSEYSFDKRLKYWKNSLQQRRKIANKIKSKTGKTASAVLFNRLTTVDDRDKQTVKRLMDYAERMKPDILINKKKIHLREYDDPCTHMHINELVETLPKAEQLKCKIVEISGLPAVTRQEQLGKVKDQGHEKKYQWMKSKVLESHIEDNRENIERVIEYYPDIDNLQIVGESMHKSFVLKHNSEIKLLREERIFRISSDTSLCDEAAAKLKAHEEELVKKETEPPEYGMKINDQIFILMTKRSSKNVDVAIPFVCEPFEVLAKRVLRIENIGRKSLNCEWVHRSYYAKALNLLKPLDKEFLFNRCPFRLIAGEARDLVVTFQPRKVDVFKEKWLLKIDPQFFCRKMDGVVIRLNGRCKPPIEYVNKLIEIQNDVIGKSNLKAMKSLTTGLGTITPLIKPDEVICPYKRLLSERELFEFLNEGYKCERFHDLELLKGIHKRVKKPREPAWDLKLETLKALILRLESATRRALVFAEMLGIVQEMKGKPAELEAKIVDNPERDQTRLVYVRGIISTSIDEWEELTATIEEAFLRPAIKEYYEELWAQEEALAEEEEGAVKGEGEGGGGDGDGLGAAPLLLVDESLVRPMLLKKIFRRKAFRDTLYVQTYTHMCNFIEDIVSIIESTEIV